MVNAKSPAAKGHPPLAKNAKPTKATKSKEGTASKDIKDKIVKGPVPAKATNDKNPLAKGKTTDANNNKTKDADNSKKDTDKREKDSKKDPKDAKTKGVKGKGKDQGGGTKAREHSKEFIKAFAPIKFFLVIIGQMPFDIKKKKDNTYSFKFSWKAKSAYIFLFFFITNTTAYLLVTAGIFTFLLKDLFKQYIHPTYKIIVKDYETLENTPQLWERYYTRREMVSVLVVWSWMTIAFAGSLYTLLNQKEYIHYMNYFNRVVQLIDMDMTPGIKQYLWRHNLLSIGTAVAIITGFVLQIHPFNFHAVANTASVIANFILRLFGIEMVLLDGGPGNYAVIRWQFYGCQILGFLIMLLALVGSRANMIQFLFFSQLLKNGAKIWNKRFEYVLENDSELKESEKPTEDSDDPFRRRLSLRQILKDHIILTQLFKMTENNFGPILLTYYCFVIISVVMEIYQLAALGGFQASDDKIFSNDTGTSSTSTELPDLYEVDKQQEFEALNTAIVCIVLLLQNIWFAIAATVDAAGAYEQAMEGFHILRQHGFMYCRNKADRNFVLTMFLSFSKFNPMELTAGGYFAINRALLVAMVATIINWAVSIYQTKIDQWR